MALIKVLNKQEPQIPDSVWLAENAVVIGDVKMGADCSIWYYAVIRGDVNSIKIGSRVNIQDHAMIHCTYQRAKTEIGNDVSIGHRAIVHGCTIHDKVLIGMGAIVMDHCIVESNSIIAAGAVVLEGTHIESGSLYAGVPAKKVRDISGDQLSLEIDRIAANYVKYSGWYKE